MSCPLGWLFNKEAVLEALLAGGLPPECAHIRGLKDLTTLRLRRNPAAGGGGPTGKGAGGGGGRGSGRAAGEFVGEAAPFVCPATGLEMNGRAPFRVCRRTGLVVSARALREFPVIVEEMLAEAAAGKKKGAAGGGDWVPLNGTVEEVATLRVRLGDVAGRRGGASSRPGGEGGKHRKRKPPPGAEGAAPAVKRPANPPRLQGSTVLPSSNKFKAVDHLPEGAGDREVYASIFTSSREGEEKETFMCRSVSARGNHLS